MAFFDDISKKITQTGQDAVKKAKDMAESAQISSQIRDEEKAVNEYYRQIGEQYFKIFKSEPQPEFTDLCDAITDCITRISSLKMELQKARNVKVCAQCGAENDINTKFCGSCGAKLIEAVPDDTTSPQSDNKTCPQCGSISAVSAVFCTSCGKQF